MWIDVRYLSCIRINYRSCLYTTLHDTSLLEEFHSMLVALLNYLASCWVVSWLLQGWFVELTADHMTLLDVHCTLATYYQVSRSNLWSIHFCLCMHPENYGRVENGCLSLSTMWAQQLLRITKFFHTISCPCYMLSMKLYWERLSSFSHRYGYLILRCHCLTWCNCPFVTPWCINIYYCFYN